MTNSNEILQNALKSMSNEDKAKIFPPIDKKELCSPRKLDEPKSNNNFCEQQKSKSYLQS